jgi:4-amino-4-deoxy-L-arabinose transferase-like glycosyltransferase
VADPAVVRDGFTWTDADHYMQQAQALAAGQGGLATRAVAAVRYFYLGFPFYLPPLYPFFLALFALVPAWYPASAAVAQAFLGALSVPLAWWTGRLVHSERAGLVAGVLVAAWVPSITSGGVFIQEHLYIPLLLASFALLVRATARSAGLAAFAVAGAAFGLAALTRSMPAYFVPVAAGIVWAGREHGLARAAAFVAGFAAVTLPYSLFLSIQTGSLIFIENHAGLSLWGYGGDLKRVPTVANAGLTALGQLVSAPLDFVRTWSDYVRLLLKPQGGRWLETTVIAGSASEAVLLKWVARLGVDVPFVLVAVLWPLGAALARRRREAMLIACWILCGLALTALAGTAGPRYRSPFEPHMMVLAAVVPGGTWRRPSRPWLWLAAAASALVSLAVVTQLSASARGRAEYGIRGWVQAVGEKNARSAGSAGFNVMPLDGTLQFTVRPTGPAQAVTLEVRVEGHLIARSAPAPGAERAFRVAWPRLSPGFVAVENRDATTGSPAACAIRVVTAIPRRTE